MKLFLDKTNSVACSLMKKQDSSIHNTANVIKTYTLSIYGLGAVDTNHCLAPLKYSHLALELRIRGNRQMLNRSTSKKDDVFVMTKRGVSSSWRDRGWVLLTEGFGPRVRSVVCIMPGSGENTESGTLEKSTPFFSSEVKTYRQNKKCAILVYAHVLCCV